MLVSLAVIFVPMLFDEPHSERTSSSINIPEEPPFPEVDAPEPPAADAPAYRLEESGEPEPVRDSGTQQQVQRVDEVEEPVSETLPDPAPEAQPAEPVAQEPAPTPEPESQESDQQADSAEYAGSLDGAWVVQLGSFGSADNARNLRNKIRDQGYNSHLQKIQRGDTTLTRVFSGPFAEKAEAERAKRALDREFGLNSLVTSGGK